MWFKSSEYGDEKDRVVRKADGDYTYFASDVAYHYWKKERGFDILIDIWGADHHGYIARVAAVLAAMGFPGALEVMLGQLVNLFRDGKPVRMSKRTGEMIAFEELIDEVGIDATRYYMLSRSTEQPIDFDIDVAKKQDSSNPVYYVQYAHARICKLLRDEAGHSGEDNLDMAAVASEAIPADVDLSVLTAPEGTGPYAQDERVRRPYCPCRSRPCAVPLDALRSGPRQPLPSVLPRTARF